MDRYNGSRAKILIQLYTVSSRSRLSIGLQ